MRPWMKVSLLIVVILGLSWGGAIWFWRETNRMPAPGDMVTYLVAVPLGILAALWLGRVVMNKMAAAPAAPAPAGAASAPATAPAPVAPALAIVAAAMRTPHGAAADELSAKLLDGKARGELDPELVNDQGFPIMTLRSGDAGDPATEEEVTAWFAASGVQDLELTPGQWRALTLATSVTADLAGQAVGSLHGNGTPPMLYLQPMLPADWRLDLRAAAGLWLRHVVLQSGWPEQRLTAAAAVPADARGASPAAVLGRLAHQANASGMPLVAIVVACASSLSEQCVQEWSAQDIMFSAQRPMGRIPGEGAAGLLLADVLQAGAVPGLAYNMLHLEPEARRHNSADEAKKADAKALATLAAKLLADTGTDPGKVAMLVTDTDHRTTRVMESMELASGTLPHLDLATEVLSVGAACGACGSVPYMAALGLAQHHATELAAPVLCISNDDPYRRSAILIKPAAALS